MHRSREQHRRVTSAVTRLQTYLNDERSGATSETVVRLIDESISYLASSGELANKMTHSGVLLITRSMEFAKVNADEILSSGDNLRATQTELLTRLEQTRSAVAASNLLGTLNQNQQLLELNAGIYQISMVGHDLLTWTIDSTLADALNGLVKIASQRPGNFDFIGVLTELVTEVNSHYASNVIELAGFPQYAFLGETISPFTAILTKFIERRHLGRGANEYLSYLEDLPNALTQWCWAAQSATEAFDVSLLPETLMEEEDPCQT